MIKTTIKAFTICMALFMIEPYTSAHSLHFINPKDKSALSTSFLNQLYTLSQASSFVETGTYTGTSTLRAMPIFKNVYTIEFSEFFYTSNLPTFKKYKNITALHGDSSSVLGTLIPHIKEQNCIFYLDAHYSGGKTAKGITNTPLLEEIKIIGKHMPDSIIIIDDLRLCQPEILVQKQLCLEPNDTTICGYPSITQLRELLHAINPEYIFVVWGDAGIAFPKNKYSSLELSMILVGMTSSRFFEECNVHTIEETLAVLKAEEAFIHASHDEVTSITSLLKSTPCLWKPELFTTHYKLWNALVYIGQGHLEIAKTLIEQSRSLGLTHWRTQWYLASIYLIQGNHAKAQEYLNQIKDELNLIGLTKMNAFESIL